MECIRICPTGALSKIPKVEVRLGKVVLNRDVCTTWLGTRRCDRCFRACRAKAISLQDRRYPIHDPEKCEACSICIRQCPEPGALYLDPSEARRYQPQPGRFLLTLEDRVGPYEVPPPSYPEWFYNRIRILARYYGLIE